MFATVIVEYSDRLESFLVMPKDQIIFFTSTINHYYNLKEGLETLTFSTPTNNYCSGLRKKLETLISPTSTNNHCCNLKKGLETQPAFTTFTSFVSNFDILDIILFSIELFEIGNTM